MPKSAVHHTGREWALRMLRLQPLGAAALAGEHEYLASPAFLAATHGHDNCVAALEELIPPKIKICAVGNYDVRHPITMMLPLQAAIMDEMHLPTRLSS